jgi:hypothetical protein
MPWVDPAPDDILMQTPMGQEMGPEPKPPSLGQIVSSAFNRENLVANMARKLSEERNPVEPDYNPMQDELVKGTRFEFEHAPKFAYAYSRRDTQQIIADIEREDRDNEILAAGGAAGIAASAVAGLLDPTIFLPGGAYYKAGKSGLSILKTAASVSAAGAGTVALQETGLQLSQRTRPMEESVMNVGAAALLAGFHGARVRLG